MSTLEAGLRGGTVAIRLLAAILFLRDSGRTSAGRNAALFLLSAVCYVICSTPERARFGHLAKIFLDQMICVFFEGGPSLNILAFCIPEAHRHRARR